MSKFTSPFGDLTVFKIDGVEYFVGVELCKILAYTNTNKTLADHVPYQYKLLTYDPEIIAEAGFDKRVKSLTLVSEKGVYALAMKSRMPKAVEFQDWVYNLLVKIRKGDYGPELQSEMYKHVAPMFQTPEEFYPKNDYRLYGTNRVNQFLQDRYNLDGTAAMINDRGDISQRIIDDREIGPEVKNFYSDFDIIYLAFKLSFGINFTTIFNALQQKKFVRYRDEMLDGLTPEAEAYMTSVRNHSILNMLANGLSIEVVQMIADSQEFNSPYNLIKSPIIKSIFKIPEWNIVTADIAAYLTDQYRSGNMPRLTLQYTDLEDNQ